MPGQLLILSVKDLTKWFLETAESGSSSPTQEAQSPVALERCPFGGKVRADFCPLGNRQMLYRHQGSGKFLYIYGHTH